MRLSRYHAPTLREAPRDAEIVSHELLVRAGFIRQLSAGIYNLMPLGVRTVTKIANIVREEMNRAGAIEVLMPAVQPGELWKESGRWQKYGPELLRFQDRKGNDFCLGPTHEEVITDMVRRDVRSYKQLPLNLYQIQAKFRDELRPRAGLMRGREFMMKDAYSFDVDEASARESYQLMYKAYERIFERCGLAFRAVEADTGNIGGTLSHEFQVLAETGEDAIVSCDSCTYTANVEMAELPVGAVADAPTAAADPTVVDTPGQHTVEEVCAFMDAEPASLIKTLILSVDGAPVAALVRGDRELNPLKIKRLYDAETAELASDELVTKVTGAPVGFAGPVGLDIPVVADPEVMAIAGAICGANAAHKHLSGVAPGLHFTPSQVADLRMAEDGDPCARCEGTLRAYRGIEVGHVFYLGTKYSDAMDCTFLDANGKSRSMEMGCYGIGVTRIMAAAIEQHHDEQGIAWPMALAPFEVAVIPLGKPGDEASQVAEKMYLELLERGVDAILDDRKERPGVKFNDADLIGYPLQIVVGSRGLADGVVELKRRATASKESVPTEDAVSLAAAAVAEAGA
jgi:prolyl-tRNA synthetase